MDRKLSVEELKNLLADLQITIRSLEIELAKAYKRIEELSLPGQG